MFFGGEPFTIWSAVQKIGEGWQYTVYDLGNGRVLKRFNSWLRTMAIIVRDCVPGEWRAVGKIPSYIPELRSAATRSFEVIRIHDLPTEWLGHPVRREGLDFGQDKFTPLFQVLAVSSFEESKAVVDRFVVFADQLLRRGVIDKFFNIAKNFGVNQKGEVVLLDLGELVADEAEIVRQRTRRIWAADYKLKSIKDRALREYFVEQMDFHFGLR
jgi:hypothetical protein